MGARMRHSGPSVSGLSAPVPLGKNEAPMVPFAENTPMNRLAGLAAAPNDVAGFQIGVVSATVSPPSPPRRRRRVNLVRLAGLMDCALAGPGAKGTPVSEREPLAPCAGHPPRRA